MKKNFIPLVFGFLFVLSVLSVAYIMHSHSIQSSTESITWSTQQMSERTFEVHYENLVEVVIRTARSLLKF